MSIENKDVLLYVVLPLIYSVILGHDVTLSLEGENDCFLSIDRTAYSNSDRWN